MKKATCVGVFDGDTLSYELFADGISAGLHWSTNDLRIKAASMGLAWEGEPPALSHIPHPDDAHLFPEYTGQTSLTSTRHSRS